MGFLPKAFGKICTFVAVVCGRDSVAAVAVVAEGGFGFGKEDVNCAS